MRLTLRTLLAYVDDILEPAQAKEIGGKISESGFATSLMNRIQDVMRRRRLTAPDLEGPGSGLDPNIVAEYIDNVLPPDKVADVEKVCLESDVHLAEVAASHQILTAALGEAVQVAHESREHMYALGPSAKSSLKSVPEGTARKVVGHRPKGGRVRDTAVRQSAAVAPGAAGTKLDGEPADRSADSGKQGAASTESSSVRRPAGDFDATIPDFLRPRPLWRRALPYTVVCLIAAAWVALLVYGSPLNPLNPSSDNRVQNGQDGQGGDAQLAANLNAGGAASQDGTDGRHGAAATPVSPAGRERAGAARSIDEQTIDPPPPADAVDGAPVVAGTQPPADVQLPVVAPDVPGSNPNAAENAGKPNEVAVGVPAVIPNANNGGQPPVQSAVLQYNSQEGILLRYDEQVKDWMVLPPRAIIHPGERFASPAPFEAVIDVGDSLCRATLVSETAVRVLPPSKEVAAGFKIGQGRVILENKKPAAADQKDPANPDPVAVATAVKDELWKIELMTPGTVCGIEIVPVQPEQPGYDPARDTYAGGLYVVSGSVRFADGTAPPRVIEAAGWMSLAPADRRRDKEEPAVVALPLLSVPQWLDPAAEQSARTVRRYATLFEKEFDLDRPLSENVPPMIKDPRAYISSLAVKCLALVGDYASLAKALGAEHEESRMAAIEGLRNWLPRGEENGKLLKAELQTQFPPEDADAVERLLWGYTERDVMDRTTSDRLVGWLDHNDVVIRELAFYHIYRLTGIKYDYNPLRPPLQRRSAIRRWEERIQSEGALLGQPAATP